MLEFQNFLYAVGMLMEFAAFIKLRISKPDLHRPYRVPVGTLGAILISLPPAFLLVLVMCLASARTFILSSIVIVLGFVSYPAIQYMKHQKWFKFISTPEISEGCFGSPPHTHEVDDEVSVNLLPDRSFVKELQDSEFNLGGASKLE